MKAAITLRVMPEKCHATEVVLTIEGRPPQWLWIDEHDTRFPLGSWLVQRLREENSRIPTQQRVTLPETETRL